MNLEETECMQETTSEVDTDGEEGMEERQILRARVQHSAGIDSCRLPLSLDKNKCYKNNAVSSLYT